MSLSERERFIVGILALAGVPYEVAYHLYGISTAYYYKLKEKSNTLLDCLFHDGKLVKEVILVTQIFIERCVLALTFYCRAPIEGIVSFFDLVLGFHISKGTIHNIRERARQRAELFDSQVSLENIKIVATDEIFQQDEPILTAVDLETRYIVLMDLEVNRTGETWSRALSNKTDQGFCPEVNVSDGGSGLMKGISGAFPKIKMQLDVFHTLRDLGVEINKCDRFALAKLTEYYDLEDRVQGKRRHKKTVEAYEKARAEIDSHLKTVDTLNILYEWLREYVGFSGYSYAKSLWVCNWILDEMASLYTDNKKLIEAITRFRKHLPDILQFQVRLEKALYEETQAYHVDSNAFILLYNQMSYPAGSAKYEILEKKLFHLFREQLPEARESLRRIIKQTYRASSMIENVNECIRDFIDLKREIPDKFFVLLKVFFNTKKSIRSRHNSWIGRSALDRLTGKTNPDFLDIVVGPNLIA